MMSGLFAGPRKPFASAAAAQAWFEFRRTGNYEEAVSICRTGLQTHPSYLSARVTLGRALLEMNDLENAEAELRYVLQHAAENLAAIRAMAEIHHRRGELTEHGEWTQRDGPFLRNGFRLRVIHCFWTFSSIAVCRIS